VPDELARILGADVPHSAGVTGRGVRVAVIDSGFYPHPFYLRSHYRIRWMSTENDPDPEVDRYGHGTAQLACLFSIAPEAEVFAIKCTEVDPSTGILKALEHGAEIISCAWGFDIDRPPARKLPRDFKGLHSLIRETVRQGVCVVAAAGNGQRSFPSCMPEVISAGGAYYDKKRNFHPSDLCTAYESTIFPGRTVPDVCGLAGKLPHGRLLLLPVPPEARIARRPDFRLCFANAEERKAGAGWALFSGTSAATAMVSGAAALIRQTSPRLSPDEVRARLIESSREVAVPNQSASHVLDLKKWFHQR
jgi:subtilisin family serine protease